MIHYVWIINVDTPKTTQYFYYENKIKRLNSQNMFAHININKHKERENFERIVFIPADNIRNLSKLKQLQ